MRPGSFGMLEVINGPVGVEDEIATPYEFRLESNYPNPFNPTTTISYELANKSNISIVVYDVLGAKVRTLVDRDQAAGKYTIQWDGKNDAGVTVSNGVYFYRLKSDLGVKTKKMMFIK